MTQWVRKQPQPEVVDAYQNTMPYTITVHGVSVPPFSWAVMRDGDYVSVFSDTAFRSLWECIQLTRMPRASLL